MTALLDLLRARVATALIELGVPEPLALKAADSAAAQLATTIAGDSRNAAEIVHALLERLQTGIPDTTRALLNMVANGITVIIDHETGDIRVTSPQVNVTPSAPTSHGTAPAHHLLDVTDYSAEKATPVLQALNTVQSTASAYARNIGAMPATINTTSANASPAAGAAIPATEIITSAAQLKPVTDPGSPENGAADNRIILSAGRVAVAIDTTNGAVTVQVGNRITTYAVASATTPIAAIAPLPEIEAASLPVLDLPSGLHPGRILDLPAGTPFVPPEINDMPPVGTPIIPAPVKPRPAPAQTAGVLAMTLEEGLQHLDPQIIRNAAIIHGMEASSGPNMPTLTRIALDLTAEIGPGLQGAAIPPPVGKLGLPQAAPQQSAAGPVRKNGYTDAASNLVPVLPPTYRRGDLITRQKKKDDKKKQQLPSGQYQNILVDDTMTREMPAGHRGLVFSSVVFSV